MSGPRQIPESRIGVRNEKVAAPRSPRGDADRSGRGRPSRSGK
jgi:hypothetical protein